MCIFCKVANGEVKTTVVAKNDLFVAILNTTPYAPGHTLILPRRHVGSYRGLEPWEVGAFFDILEKVEKYLIEERGAKGIRWWSNEGKAAGQTIAHLHIHVLPFYRDEVPKWLIRALKFILKLSAWA